jgi:hypothetical protein
VRFTVIFPAVVLAACAALALSAASRPPPPAAAEPATGMEMLRAFDCHRAETKQILVRGVEDDFSPAGDEPNYLRPERRSPLAISFVGGGSYDQSQPDRRFTDSFDVPARISAGLFVIGMKPVAPNGNDGIGIGKLIAARANYRDRSVMTTAVSLLETNPGWSRHGHLYSAPLDRIVLSIGQPGVDDAPRSLLDYIRSGEKRQWVDVMVQDDTAVDFMGLAVCVEPPKGRGLTFAPDVGAPNRLPGFAGLACSFTEERSRVCNPYLGDTPCETALPLACLLPMEAPVPVAFNRIAGPFNWTGGRLALTRPVRGDSLKTIGDADRFCASSLGPGWRTATHHDGLRGIGLTGFGRIDPKAGRAWVDIADQPYATCWKR